MTGDVNALIAEARRVVGAPTLKPKVPNLVLIERLADALEAAAVAPAVDREALATVLAAGSALDGPGDETVGQFGERLADALLTSGLLRDVRDVQAEALEQAAKAMRSDRDDFYVDVALGGADFVAEWVDARAQAIREARSED